MYSYRVEQAIRAATILHKDQVRKGAVPIPYASHLFAVTLLVQDYTKDEDVTVAALLHDTIEDTDYTAEELQEDFGGKVREIVESLSEPQDDKYQSYSWKEQKQHYAKKLKKASDEALLIAAADKIHNMRNIVEEYMEDHQRFIADFDGDLEDRIYMYQDIANVINKNLKNDILSEFNHVFTEYKNFVTDVQKTKEERQNA